MKKFGILFIAAIFAASCTPDMKTITIPDALVADQVNITVTPTTTANVYDVNVTVPEGIVKIDLDNGTKINGTSGQAIYPFKGTYTINVDVASKGGITNKKAVVQVADDNYELLNDPVYNFLTGGTSATNGRTWVVDSLSKGHMGVGPTTSFIPEWWAAPPMDKKGKQIYDDEITFVLKGAKVNYNNGGKSYVNGAAKNAMVARGALVEAEAVYGPAGGDFVATYATGNNWTWSITKENGKSYINFPAGQAFFMYFVDPCVKYEILSISDNELSVRVEVPGLAWYVSLVRKGWVR
ncbi:MAG: hypothetical protein PHV20_01135 [Bacteroidales bacterium]|nr:hypothetical protein [Bacteroidales bacterium]